MSVPMCRANKPLGWFIADEIVEKMGATVKPDESKSPEDKKKKRTRRLSKKSIDLMSSQTPSEGSVTSDDLFDEKRSDMPRDDYWYYDVASDGYYYEQNGAKGWRRRMPNSALQKIKEQETAQLAANGKTPAVSPSVQAAAQAALLQSALFTPPALNNSRYYDPSSDGFFYEMASVDGWKRRQPVARPPSAQPASPGSSYGAALARGQLPRTSIIDDSSASSSVSEDTISTDPFGADSGFSMLDPYVPRPNSLNFDDTTILPGFNPEKFIQDLSFSGLDASKMIGFRTPAENWATRCNNWTVTKDVPPQSPEEESMGLLLKGLENIWAQPTPVKNP